MVHYLKSSLRVYYEKILLCISLSVILVVLSACGGGSISYPTVDTPAELPWRATAKAQTTNTQSTT